MPDWVLLLIFCVVCIGFPIIIIIAITCTNRWWKHKEKQDLKTLTEHPDLNKMIIYLNSVEDQKWDERNKLTKLRDDLESLKKQLSEAPERYCKELEAKIEQTKEAIYIKKLVIQDLEETCDREQSNMAAYVKKHNIELYTIRSDWRD